MRRTKRERKERGKRKERKIQMPLKDKGSPNPARVFLERQGDFRDHVQLKHSTPPLCYQTVCVYMPYDVCKLDVRQFPFGEFHCVSSCCCVDSSDLGTNRRFFQWILNTITTTQRDSSWTLLCT